MGRPLAFTVTRRGITVRVTVLPTPRDVTRAFLEGSGRLS